MRLTFESGILKVIDGHPYLVVVDPTHKRIPLQNGQRIAIKLDVWIDGFLECGESLLFLTSLEPSPYFCGMIDGMAVRVLVNEEQESK